MGKSSFMNKLTRAEVDVQPYAFTTKSLFVGHMDYKYLRWQVIDTPGILDHPLEQRNTIEMQSITAMAHLRACVLFFMDLSEQCGYSIADQVRGNSDDGEGRGIGSRVVFLIIPFLTLFSSAQCKLYHSIKALFVNKPVLLVINKIDVMRPEQLPEKEKALINEIMTKDGIQMVQSSCYTDEGVMDVRNSACDILLASRVENKMKNSTKVQSILNKLHLTQPMQRDEKARPVFIPEGAKNKVKYDKNDPNRRKLARDVELENGGAGVFNVNLKGKSTMGGEEERMGVKLNITSTSSFRLVSTRK